MQLSIYLDDSADGDVRIQFLTNAGHTHSGIFVVYFDNDTRRDMSDHDIVRAIDNLLASGLPIVNEFHILNQWR